MGTGFPPNLPRATDAEIDPKKLRDYALDPEHERGRHKARVFSSALGIGQGDSDYLIAQIREKLPEARVAAIRPSGYDYQYEVTIWIDGLNGASHPVLTAWLLPEDGAAPRLTTLYVDL